VVEGLVSIVRIFPFPNGVNLLITYLWKYTTKAFFLFFTNILGGILIN